MRPAVAWLLRQHQKAQDKYIKLHKASHSPLNPAGALKSAALPERRILDPLGTKRTPESAVPGCRGQNQCLMRPPAPLSSPAPGLPARAPGHQRHPSSTSHHPPLLAWPEYTRTLLQLVQILQMYCQASARIKSLPSTGCEQTSTPIFITFVVVISSNEGVCCGSKSGLQRYAVPFKQVDRLIHAEMQASHLLQLVLILRASKRGALQSCIDSAGRASCSSHSLPVCSTAREGLQGLLQQLLMLLRARDIPLRSHRHFTAWMTRCYVLSRQDSPPLSRGQHLHFAS